MEVWVLNFWVSYIVGVIVDSLVSGVAIRGAFLGPLYRILFRLCLKKKYLGFFLSF